jgi:hypothetical protein
MWNASRMNPTDYSDVSAATYTYLLNGTTAAGNWTGWPAPVSGFAYALSVPAPQRSSTFAFGLP